MTARLPAAGPRPLKTDGRAESPEIDPTPPGSWVPCVRDMRSEQDKKIGSRFGVH